MAEELDLETYLYVSQNKFEIFLFNKKNLKNIYEDKIIFNNKKNYIDLNSLDKFLTDNIFKIEKLSKNFVKNIFLIIENKEINQINFGIKKKGYENDMSRKLLQNILNDAKDLFKENYHNQNIMHIIINRYFENGNYHSSFNNKFRGDYLCVEFNLIFISNNFVSEINKVLKKYQVALAGCLDGNYIKNFFKSEKIEYSKMIYKIRTGFNENEVKLISKNLKKLGFFERFFQLFS